jgi:energy-converting hydrogenase Eha subunit F
MWAIILQLLVLRLAIHRLLGHNYHPHHHYNRPIPKASSQKGTITLNSNGKFREESEARTVKSIVPESKHIY